MRIELTTSAWKAEVLPLNYTRKWRETESNRRHMELQSIALPTELPSRNKGKMRDTNSHMCIRPLPLAGLGNFSKNGSCWIRTNDRSVMSREL